MSYKIIPNLLPEIQFKGLQHYIMSNNFPWFFVKKLNVHQTDDKDNNEFYLNKVIYNDANNVRDNYSFNMFQPLVNALKIKTLCRIHVNCYIKSKELIEHTPHRDQLFPCKAAVFSLNTCNGYTTLVEDKVNIPSIENQVVIFNGDKLHNSTSVTDSPRRVNINLNWYDK